MQVSISMNSVLVFWSEFHTGTTELFCLNNLSNSKPISRTLSIQESNFWSKQTQSTILTASSGVLSKGQPDFLYTVTS